MWLGMTVAEQEAATGYLRDDVGEMRTRYRDGILKSMTSIAKYIHPIESRIVYYDDQSIKEINITMDPILVESPSLNVPIMRRRLETCFSLS